MQVFSTASLGVAQGSQLMFSDFADYGPMWAESGARESRHAITFSRSFRTVPVVQVGIAMWDVDHAKNLRADITAENVTALGFDLVFRTWGDSRIARIRADWLALGPVRDHSEWEID